MSTKFTSKELHKAMFNNTVVVKPEQLQILPTKKCHENCEVYAELFNGRVVRGFLIIKCDFGYLYNHHSIIDHDGFLIDVTMPPNNKTKIVGFIEDKKNSDDAMYENIMHYKKHKKKKGIFKDQAFNSIPDVGLVPLNKSDADVISYAPMQKAPQQHKMYCLAILSKFADKMQEQAA